MVQQNPVGCDLWFFFYGVAGKLGRHVILGVDHKVVIFIATAEVCGAFPH